MMHCKALVTISILLMQACMPAVGQTPATEVPDSPGILQRLADRAREAKVRLQGARETVTGFAGAYYEDHIQPVTDSYFEWASNVRRSVWEKIQTAVEDYMPSSNLTNHQTP